MADLSDIYSITGAGLQAQTARIRVVAQNVANADTTPTSPNDKPYQRQIITFKNEFDRAAGVSMVKVAGVTKDTAPFGKKYDPSNPGAGPDGFVQTTNVNNLVEAMDLRQAQRSYEANLSVLDASRVMILRTIDIIR